MKRPTRAVGGGPFVASGGAMPFVDPAPSPAAGTPARSAPRTHDSPDAAAETLHRALTRVNRWRLSPTLPGERDRDADLRAQRWAEEAERCFVEGERALVRGLAEEAPSDADAFVDWFQALEQHGPGQHDPLFAWLSEEATHDQMRWFLQQEVAGEAGFEDLVALTQLKMPVRAKLEMARNYWDEMGQGHEAGMHGPMLTRLADALGLSHTEPEEVVWEALSLGNLMIAFAMNRDYAYQSIGALGAIELTAPGRAVRVNAGLKRLEVAGDARRYFALHATLDVKHSEAWLREVVHPLVEADGRRARALAEGALLRLRAGALCFARYRRELRLSL